VTAGDALALDAEARKRLASAWAGGPPAELDAAIALWQDAVRLMPPGTPHRCAVSNNLGVALLDRWERDADPDALDAAIDAGEQAIGEAAADTPAGASACVQLSKALRVRGRPADIERAIELLEHTPGAAHSLGNALYHRYELTRRRADLDAAIAQLRNADGDGDGDPHDAPARQNDLASALIARFGADGDRAGRRWRRQSGSVARGSHEGREAEVAGERVTRSGMSLSVSSSCSWCSLCARPRMRCSPSRCFSGPLAGLVAGLPGGSARARRRSALAENQRLKAIVADQALECRALKEVARGNW
jgi:hypothetical protein